MRILLVAAACAAVSFASVGAAVADISIEPIQGNGGTGNNILLTGTGGSTTVTGHLNSSPSDLVIYQSGGAELLSVPQGQAAIDGNFHTLSWSPSGTLGSYQQEFFTLISATGGNLSITVNDGTEPGSLFSMILPASNGNSGQTFEILAAAGESISRVLLNITGGTFSELRQDRISGLNPVPIPPAAALFGSALIGLGLLSRKKGKQKVVGRS